MKLAICVTALLALLGRCVHAADPTCSRGIVSAVSIRLFLICKRLWCSALCCLHSCCGAKSITVLDCCARYANVWSVNTSLNTIFFRSNVCSEVIADALVVHACCCTCYTPQDKQACCPDYCGMLLSYRRSQLSFFATLRLSAQQPTQN
jgi:hypothetical protein